MFQQSQVKIIAAPIGASITLLLALVSLGSSAPATLFSATAQQLQQLGIESAALPVVSPRRISSPYSADSVDYELEDADTGSLINNNATLDELGDLEAVASEKYGQATQENAPNDSSHQLSTNIPTTLNLNNMTSNILFGGSRKSHIIRWPNAQSSTVQSCDDGSSELKCEDENAVCKLGGCVCKTGFFLHRQSGLCQSMSDLMNNCENDYQCQAFNVDMICDTKSHERPFCDCTDGLYHDQETHTCLPCLRASMLPGPTTTPATSTTTSKNSSTSATSNSNLDQTQPTVAANSTADELPIDDTNSSYVANGPNGGIVRFPAHQLRLCKPNDLIRLGARRRQQNGGNTAGSSPYDRQLYDQTLRGPSMPPISTTTSNISSSSDPFRIRTPLEVFMGAIMLFTLFTVAWFFLQRMIHDCRAILRSLRNPDFGGTGGCAEQSFVSGGGPLNNFASTRSVANHHYFDPTGQAVARLFSGDGLNASPFSGLTSSIYHRDLAGAMVQHLAANLSPSSTSQALAGIGGGGPGRAFGIGHNEHDAALYPLTASAQQSRTAAAAAAAQLLLSPTHPAIAILRAAAAAQNPGADYAPTNFLNSMFDPPPKYEEAIAQTDYQMAIQQQQPHIIDPPPPPQLVLEQPAVATAPPPPLGDRVSPDGGIQGRTAHGEIASDDARSEQRDVSNVLSIYIPPQLDNEQASGDNLLRVASLPGNEAANNQTASDSVSGVPHMEQPRGDINHQRRASLSERRSSRRSRRGRGSISRSQQNKTQDSD